MSTIKRWRGLRALVKDAVEHGSIAVERIQKETANRPFTILEQIPPIADLARDVHEIHDVSVSSIHTIIRLVNRVVSTTLDSALDVAERIDAERASHAPPADAEAPQGAGTAGEAATPAPPEQPAPPEATAEPPASGEAQR